VSSRSGDGRLACKLLYPSLRFYFFRFLVKAVTLHMVQHTRYSPSSRVVAYSRRHFAPLYPFSARWPTTFRRCARNRASSSLDYTAYATLHYYTRYMLLHGRRKRSTRHCMYIRSH